MYRARGGGDRLDHTRWLKAHDTGVRTALQAWTCFSSDARLGRERYLLGPPTATTSSPSAVMWDHVLKYQAWVIFCRELQLLR
jgi:hypothetical protein